MPTLTKTNRAIYEFTDEELAVASVLTTLQEQYISTLIGTKEIEKAARLVAYDSGPIALQEFAMAHAYDSGYMDALLHLLATSDDNKDALQKHLEAQQASQSAS